MAGAPSRRNQRAVTEVDAIGEQQLCGRGGCNRGASAESVEVGLRQTMDNIVYYSWADTWRNEGQQLKRTQPRSSN